MNKLEKWSDETTCQFVALYKLHDCLWNSASPHYKNKNIRVRALKTIEDEMAIEGFGINEIKNKIRSLRSTYYLEIKKMQASKAGGRAASYRPTLMWFYAMQDIMAATAAARRREVENDMENYIKFKLFGGRLKLKPGIVPHKFKANDEIIQSPEKHDMVADNESSSGTPSEVDPIKTEVHVSDYEVLTITQPQINDRRPTQETIDDKGSETTDVQRKDDEDECAVFGRYVGLQLMKMPLEARTICQLNIQRLCTETLLNAYRDGSSKITVNVIHHTE